MQVAVAGVENIRNAQTILLAASPDEAHHLREFRARHDAILGNEVWRKPANGAEGALAGFPQVGAFLFGFGEPDLAGLVLPAKLNHAFGLLVESSRQAVQFHDEHRAGVERETEMIRSLDSL